MEQNEGIVTPVTEQAAQGPSAPAAVRHSSNGIFGWTDAARIVPVALTAVSAWFGFGELFPRINLIGVIGILIGGG